MSYNPNELVLRAAASALLLGAGTALCGCGGASSPELVGEHGDALTLSGITLQTVLVPRFVSAANNGGGAVNATATVAQAWETFSLIDSNGGSLESGDSVFIQAGNGQFFQALNGGGSTLNAGSTNQLGWETFKVVRQSGAGTVNNGDIVGLQDFGGSWVSAASGGGGPVFAYGGALGSWEQFKINGLPAVVTPPTPPSNNPITVSNVSFRATLKNTFVGATNDGGSTVVATATTAQAWETFSLIDVNGGSLVSGDSVYVKAGNGQYFQALNGGGSSLNAGSNNTQGWETFKLVKQSGTGTINTGDVVGLQASTGSWVSAENGGGNVFAYGGALGSWESFAIGIGSPSPPPPPPPAPPSGGMRVVGYLPNWYGSYASWVNKVDFARLTQINLAFALGDANGNLQLAPDSDIDTLVAAAHAHGVKVYPSLCGGGGDDQIVPFYQPGQVDGFVNNIIGYVQARHLDGIDVDVEAPQRMGATYDTFIAKLRARAAPLGLQVSAAVAQWMQYGMSDTTLRSFDFINVMSYDATGTWTGPGEHSTYAQAVNDLNFYTGKGVAKSRIVLGVPFYGYCWGNCGGGQTSTYLLYQDILAKFPNAWNADWIDSGGAQYSYNGTGTMAKKTALAAQYGGIMIWELGGDVSTSNGNSLLLAISKAH